MSTTVFLVAALFCIVAGCDGDSDATLDGGSCSGANRFLYEDQVCGHDLPDAGPEPCEEKGDGRCYRRCDQDTDCTDPARPHCTQIGLFAGSDYECTAVVKICKETRVDLCL